MKILSVDYGDARTGIASCDRSELLASPITVIKEHSPERLAQKISQIALDEGAELIVVGYPKNMDGSCGDRAKKCEEFKNLLQEVSSIKCDLWDERGTTITAHSFLNETNTRGKKRKAVVDAVSAVIILENYMAYRKNNGLGK